MIDWFWLNSLMWNNKNRIVKAEGGWEEGQNKIVWLIQDLS